MKNKENKNINDNENGIEIIIGDGSDLQISEVNDCMNNLRPKTLNRKKKNVIIPASKKSNEKKEDNNK